MSRERTDTARVREAPIMANATAPPFEAAAAQIASTPDA